MYLDLSPATKKVTTVTVRSGGYVLLKSEVDLDGSRPAWTTSENSRTKLQQKLPVHRKVDPHCGLNR